jgi:type I restriction enzyme S subunit
MGFDYKSLASGKFELPDGWRVGSVKDVAVVNEQSIQRDYEHERIEYIDIASIEKGTIKSTQALPLKKAPSRARRIVKDKDMLIATVRPNLEHYAFIKEAKPNMIASTGFAVVTAKQVEPRYLYYYLTTPAFTEYLTRIADSHTSTYPAFNPDVIENAELILPPKDEQRAIAHILGSLDDKIELNRKMNETLEAMARAIFKSWFVDFDPVRAKAEGRDPGLPKEIADLFPDSFEDSDIGEIPKGWRVSTVGEVFSLAMGQSPPGETYNEVGDGIPFFQGRADFGFRYPARRVYCTVPTRFANPGDTIVSVRAPVGDINMALEKCCVGRGVAAIRHKSGSRSYTYYAMHTLKDRFAGFEAEGTVFGSITKKQFENLQWMVHPSETVATFEKLVFPIDARIETNIKESSTLAAIRDALLPKLISGEIRVKDAEKIVEGAA